MYSKNHSSHIFIKHHAQTPEKTLRSLRLRRRDVRACPSLLITSLALPDARPFLLVGRLVDFIGGKFRGFLVFDFFGKEEVKRQINEGDDSEASL